MMTLFIGLLAGGFGWWVTNFFLRPLQKIEELRQRAHEELIFYANLGPADSDTDREAAQLALRRIAAGLEAAAESASFLVRVWAARWKGWNLQYAGTLLVAESHVFHSGTSPNFVILARDNFDQALRLPPRYSKEVVSTARSAWCIQQQASETARIQQQGPSETA